MEVGDNIEEWARLHNVLLQGANYGLNLAPIMPRIEPISVEEFRDAERIYQRRIRRSAVIDPDFLVPLNPCAEIILPNYEPSYFQSNNLSDMITRTGDEREENQ